MKPTLLSVLQKIHWIYLATVGFTYSSWSVWNNHGIMVQLNYLILLFWEEINKLHSSMGVGTGEGHLFHPNIVVNLITR